MKNNIFVCFFLYGFMQTTIGQWQPSAGTSGLNMQSLLAVGPSNLAGGQTGAYISMDDAASFVSSNTGNDNVGPTRCFTYDVDYLYTCTSQGAFRSADNGATWVSKSNGLSNLLGSSIINVGTKLFYVGPTGVFMSTDQGENWSQAGLPTTDVRSIASINDTIFVGTNGSGIYKSTDWGATWQAINNGLNGATSFRAIETKGNTLFAGGPIGTGVFRSTDFGNSWTLLSNGLTSGSYRGFASNTQLIVAGSFGAGVFYSIDNGDTWVALNDGLTDLTIFDLEINGNYLMAATNTQGVFRYDLSTLNLFAPSHEMETLLLVNGFPNPMQEFMTLNIDLKLMGKKYLIINELGHIVLEGLIKSANEELDLRHLPMGSYHFVLKEGQNLGFGFIKN